jgi:hypothetical protein
LKVTLHSIDADDMRMLMLQKEDVMLHVRTWQRCICERDAEQRIWFRR